MNKILHSTSGLEIEASKNISLRSQSTPQRPFEIETGKRRPKRWTSAGSSLYKVNEKPKKPRDHKRRKWRFIKSKKMQQNSRISSLNQKVI